MIKYRYAKGSDDNLFDVLSLNESTRRLGAPYSCYGCDGELIPNLPTTKKTPYFSHKVKENCSKETYLHKLAKRTFYKNYTEALAEKTPFLFTFLRPFSCNYFESSLNHTCSGYGSEKFDLTTVYKRVTLEEKIGEFIPDIALTSEKHAPIFIEIVVSHESSQRKLLSGNKIIEITISSEDDISAINSRNISANAANVITHNIEGKTKKGNICDGECAKPGNFFVVYNSGKVRIISETPVVVLRKIHQFRVLSTAITAVGGDGFQSLLANLRHHHFMGADIKNCLLCEHQGMGEISGISCRAKSIKITSSDAITCKQYAPFKSIEAAKVGEKKNMQEHIEQGEQLAERMLRGYR